jgi:hypothetical protein
LNIPACRTGSSICSDITNCNRVGAKPGKLFAYRLRERERERE